MPGIRNKNSASQESDCSNPARLNGLQIEVLDKLSDGFTLAEISRELGLSEITVRAILKIIMNMLGTDSSNKAVAIYQKNLKIN